MDYTKAEAMVQPVLAYADTLGDADKLRLAAYVISLANAVQQKANVEVESVCIPGVEIDEDDEMPISYHLHNACENLAEALDDIADEVA